MEFVRFTWEEELERERERACCVTFVEEEEVVAGGRGERRDWLVSASSISAHDSK